jgi:competence protein ComEA
VVRPGLYRRPAGDRVVDLIDAAGGALANARPDMLNLAAHLVDGSRVWVPSDDDQVDPMPSAEAGSVNALINVNRATAEQLEALPGVGPSLAAAIVDHRGRSGPVSTVDDLLSVPGIGPGKLAALRDRVVV